MIAPCQDASVHPPHAWFAVGDFPHRQSRCVGVTGPAVVAKRVDSQAKGKRYELSLVKYLRANGFPDARRTVRTGYRTATEVAQDEGDISDTPGLCFQMKAFAKELVPGKELDRVYGETRAQSGDRMALLVCHRNGFGDPGKWWLWLDIGDLLYLHGAERERRVGAALVRCSLQDLIKEMLWFSQEGL